MDGNKQNQEANSQNKGFKSGWTDDEKRALAAITFPLIEMQKAYGRHMDAKLVMQGWQIKFAGRYSVDQIIYALDKYTDKNDDFPSPANLISILNPEEPKITESQFIEAQKWQERNNDWSKYTGAYDTITKYKQQKSGEDGDYRKQVGEIDRIGSGGFTRIGEILKIAKA